MIIVVPLCLKDADGAGTRSDQLLSLFLSDTQTFLTQKHLSLTAYLMAWIIFFMLGQADIKVQENILQNKLQ